MTSLQAKIESVKSAVTSTTTCTPTTASILSDLLLSKTVSTDNKDASAPRATGRARAATQTRAGKVQRPTSRGTLTASQNTDIQQASILLPKEKAILATEIINVTLKTLSAAAAPAAPIRRQPQSREQLGTPMRKALRRSNSVPQSPLQQRSLNRVTSSPNIANRSSRSPSSSSSSASCNAAGQKAIAECSRIAFACLRTLQSSKPPSIDLPPLQLENGMSALIGKFITLGLDDLALKELRILKRRLDVALKSSEKSATKKTTTKEASQTSTAIPLGFDGLLDFEIIPTDEPLLTLAITTQLQVLKLMRTSKKPSAILPTISKLQPDYHSSPTQLLLRFSKISSAQATKAARQLETLAQLILSLSPTISSSEDAVALSPKLHVSPATALQLQTIAFCNRWTWWEIVNHEGDAERDIFEPYSRCLAAFTRRTRGMSTSRYESAEESFATLLDFMAEGSGPTATAKSPLYLIYKLLGSLAQDCGRDEQAIYWIEKLRACGNASEAQRCSVASKLAALKLRIDPHDANIEELLMVVLEGLDSSMKGESTELDELLAEVSKARRAAIMLLSKKSGPNETSFAAISEGTREMCESLVLQCPRFSLRYLGKTPSDDAATKVIVRFEQRRQYLTKTASSTIDSALYLIKVLRTEGRSTWEMTDSLLQDCLALLESVDAGTADTNDDADAARASYFVRISNLYYSQHLDMRRDASSPKDFQHLRPLRRSIDSIRARPPAERRAAALTSKLERMSDLLRLAGRQDEARDIIIFLRDELVGDGALRLVAAAAATLPIRAAWDESESTSLLARAFSLLVRLDKRRIPNSLQGLALYEETLASQEKGALLEHILDVLSRHPADSINLQKDIYKELISTYEPRMFPVRRLRVISNFVQSNPDLRREIIEEARNTITLASLDSVIENSHDTNLRSYVPHFQSLLTSSLELLENHPRIDLIRPHLATWCGMIEKCKDKETLYRNVDDVDGFLSHLQSIADFLDMKGFGKLRTAVLRMITNIDEIPRESSSDDLVLDYSFLADQYLDLGYSGKAGLALDRAQCCSTSNGVTPSVLVRKLVSYAAYLLKMGNLDKCEETLSRAYTIANQDHGNPTSTAAGSHWERDGNDRIIADASIVYSDLALQRGRPQEALSHAKRSLRLMARAWKRAERQQTLRPKSLSSEDITADKMAEETSHLNMSTASAGIFTMQSSIVGASAWTLVKPMFRSFVHLSQVYAHHGMFQDTIYYAEQAHKIAVNIDSTNYIAEALVVMGNAWLRAGTVDKASEFLMQAKDLESVYKETQASVILKSHLGSLYNRHGDNAAELQAYQEAELTLNSLIDSTNISDLDRVLDAAAVLQAEMSRLTIDNRTKQTRLPRKTVSRKKAPVKKAGAVLKASVEPVVSASDQCLHLMSLKGTLLRQKARSFIQWQRSEEVSVIMKEAGSCSFGVFDAIDNHLTLAEHLFQQSSALLPADPVYSVLQESTISFPAIVGAKTASTSDRTSGVRCTPPRKNQTSSSRTTSLSRGSSTTWIEPLKQAHEHLLEAYSIASQISSTRVLNQIASFLNTTTILLSTYHGNKLRTTHPGATAGVLELVKALSVQRERDAVSLDANVSTNKEDDLRWPVVTVHDHQKDGNGRLATQQARFQKEYIDIIPAAWTVVSVTLSETRQELVLTKFEAGHCPFILRVPLGRNNSRDADEEVFGFDQGKAELTDIIDLANASAHGGRDVSGKAAKIAWWTERDELNDRLKELLDNIEKVWLGGFRGIFSQHSRRPELLARFQKSFQNTLDKHLPSRQRTNKRTKAAQRVTLDPRILELFIGLGDPFSEDCDLDEPLTDLLYFVIDILQFHGERNAYDEIDFDSIVLDTLDALRCYHQAVNGASATKDDSHTILILDASLHSFPWESLPCMQGQSISRLPSMGCLRSRILSLAKPVEAAPDGIYIERAHGGYVLNPGQDLSSTQTTFEAPLAQLPGWTEIVAREPGEAELKEMLETQELYLYFGHGSGAQYIRSKTIKRMRRCATAVLMGCSSAAVVEAGEFSPYGPPLSYLMAGAPAVVGTLWDVTDRDVDRFAKRAFERWGLFGEGEKVEKVVKTPARRRRVEKVVEVEVEEGQERVSLVEAVARGKKACNYQYLTAAAVVVYGVPVYFK